jgi:hypothetical protein
MSDFCRQVLFGYSFQLEQQPLTEVDGSPLV